jgi:hypothetical protein
MSDDDRSQNRDFAGAAGKQRQDVAPKAATEASQIADRANDEARQVSHRLDQRALDSVVDAVQACARRRPGAYLLGCAAVGFVAATVFMSAVSTVWSMTSRTLRGVGLGLSCWITSAKRA